MSTPIGSPTAQWPVPKDQASSLIRLRPALDPASGVWGIADGAMPAAGAFVDDAASGVVGLDEASSSGLNLALLPSGLIALY